MKRRIKEYQDEFIILFKTLLVKKGIEYRGSEPIDVDENGE